MGKVFKIGPLGKNPNLFIELFYEQQISVIFKSNLDY